MKKNAFSFLNFMPYAVFFACLLSASTANAVIDVYEFDDPELEKRFIKLTYELRCPKCQNQNLADSNSELSLDLKAIVYEKLNAGETDQQILDFMKQRYGEFILFNPEVNQSNALLWAGPFIFLILIGGGFFRWYLSNRDLDDE
jgi:cytochrome c-type biogenesis protein CcmH